MGFFLRYLATALFGTLALYYGLPQLRPLMPDVIRAMSRPAAAGGSVHPLAQTPVPPDAQPVESVNVPAETLPAETVPARGIPEVPVADEAPAAPVSPPPEPVVITELGYTPSTRRIRASGADVTHWGVTLRNAPVFENDGRRRAEMLPGGSLVEQTGATNSSRGEMARCRIWRGSGWAGPYLVATAALVRFPGGRDEVDADELDLLLRYAELNARADERKKELARLSVDANPHAAPLRRLKETYDAARREAERLTQKRDAARGAERIRLGDELRRVKEQEPRMRRELEALARQYEAWKTSHAAPAADPRQDAEAQALEAQMQALRPRLGNFGL